MSGASHSHERDRDRFSFGLLGLLASLFGSCGSAWADNVVIFSNRDNTLYESVTGNLSNGAGQGMFVGRTNQGFLRRAVVHFDIAGNIPAGAIINSVTLQLQLTQTNVPTQTIDLHRLSADWGEGTSNAIGGGGQGAPAATNDATWIHRFFNSVFWTAAGGDFAPFVSASQTTGGLGAYTWSSAQLAADVQDMLSSPLGNFGWILIGDEVNSASADRFATRENSTAAFRPRLLVDFTLVQVPEPSSLALMVVGLGVFGGVSVGFRRTGKRTLPCA